MKNCLDRITLFYKMLDGIFFSLEDYVVLGSNFILHPTLLKSIHLCGCVYRPLTSSSHNLQTDAQVYVQTCTDLHAYTCPWVSHSRTVMLAWLQTTNWRKPAQPLSVRVMGADQALKIQLQWEDVRRWKGNNGLQSG